MNVRIFRPIEKQRPRKEEQERRVSLPVGFQLEAENKSGGKQSLALGHCQACFHYFQLKPDVPMFLPPSPEAI
jgi:hypothetical protein